MFHMNPNIFETAYIITRIRGLSSTPAWAPVHTKPVNMLTETAYFWNRSRSRVVWDPVDTNPGKSLWGLNMFRQIRMDEAFILVALKVKQIPKLIALPLSDTQVGTKTNKQTNKKKTKLYYL